MFKAFGSCFGYLSIKVEYHFIYSEFSLQITACLELLSQRKNFYSWMLLFSRLWLIIFDFRLLFLHKHESILKIFTSSLCVFIHNCQPIWKHLRQEDKGKLCIIISA